MKTSRILYALLFVCMFISCEHDEIEEQGTDIPNNSKFSISQAQLWYETKATYDTRTEGDDQSDFFKMGEVVPDWNLGKLSSDYNKEAVDVPITGEYSYRVVYDSVSYPLFSGLVVMNEKITSNKSDYHVFYIPSQDAVEYYTDEVCSYFRNRENRLLFSGLAVYTDEYGSPVAAERFNDGIATEGCFLYDTTATFEYNYEKMYSLLNGTRLLRIKEGSTTRSDNDELYGGEIEEIVVVAPPLPPKKKDESEDDNSTPSLPKHDDISPIQDLERSNGNGLGGGGDSSSSTYSSNTHIKIKSKHNAAITALLDLLKDDCMGSTLINSITIDLTISTEEKNGNQAGGYYPSLGLITLTDPNDMTTLIEELVHCYQHIAKDNHSTHGLNNEVDAKILWSMYVLRHGGSLSDYGGKLGRSAGPVVFEDLVDGYSPNIDFEAYENTNYYVLYCSAKDILKRLAPTSYGDESKYPFSYDFDLSVIDYLLQNC